MQQLSLDFGPKCRIQWIDKQGNPTPDKCTAVCLATCTFPDGTKGEPLPCCAQHYQKGIGFSNWAFTPISN